MEKSFYVYMQEPETMLKPCEHYREMNMLEDCDSTATAYGLSDYFFDNYQPVWKIMHVFAEMINADMDEEYQWLLAGHWDEL